MAPCVMLLSDTELITPLYGGLELPWRAAWLWRLSMFHPWGLWYPRDAHGCVVAAFVVPCCWGFDSKAQWGWDTYWRLHNDICLLVVGKFPSKVSWLMQWAHHTVETMLANPDKTEFVVFTKRRTPHCLRSRLFQGYFKSLYVGQISQGNPGFSAKLMGACGC